MTSTTHGWDAAHPRRPARALPPLVPVLWLGLGVAWWSVEWAAPGNGLADAVIVGVLSLLVLLAIAWADLAGALLVTLALTTPTITAIVAAIDDRRTPGPGAGPVVRVGAVLVAVSAPSLVGAWLLARSRIAARSNT
ncbi:MAG: hypothetical protein R2743_14520 [Ilumatobacteraceae bacterium]